MIGFVLLTLIVCTCITIYLYLTRNFNHWKRKGVNYVQPTFGVGNIGSVFMLKKSIWQVLQDIHNQEDGRFTGIFLIDKPALIVRDLDLIKSIFTTDFNHFVDRDFSPPENFEPLMAKNLFAMKGSQWKILRSKLTPTFTSGKMKNMFYLIKSCCDNLETLLKHCANSGKHFETKPILSRYNLDVITTCAFGIEGKNIEDPDWPLGNILKLVTTPSLYSAIKGASMVLAPKLLYLLPGQVLPKIVSETISNIIWSTIAYREQNNVCRNDYLDILLEIKKQNSLSNFNMDGDTLIAQAFLFLVAGFETSTTTMSLALYELSKHLQTQNKLRSEINDVLSKNNGEITYENLKEMTYLDQVIYETIRKYPILPFLDRLCVKDYQVPDSDVIIEKGTRLFFSMMGIQRDPKNFENPNEFNPDRFSEQRTNSFHKFAFLPFGEGPRNCIGKRFGMMQVKTGLVQILKGYKVSPCEFTPDEPEWNIRHFNLIIDGTLSVSLKCA